MALNQEEGSGGNRNKQMCATLNDKCPSTLVIKCSHLDLTQYEEKTDRRYFKKMVVLTEVKRSKCKVVYDFPNNPPSYT